MGCKMRATKAPSLHGRSWRMRLAMMAVFLSFLCTSCSLLPPRRPLGPTASPPSATPTPVPLLSMRGSSSSFDSVRFFAPAAGWTVQWSYDCLNDARERSRRPWNIVIRVRQSRVHNHGGSAQQLVVDAKAHAIQSQRHFEETRSGNDVITMRGSFYIEIRASAGCSWRITALPGP